MASRRQNQWFVPGEGIAREVITADIQRYLGPDALVRPGEGSGDHEGVPGYWITAYRTLTTQMITDLKLDSQRWRAEAGRVAYRDSKTHESRQYYGPTTTGNTEYPQAQAQPPAARPAAYASSGYAYDPPPQQQPAYTHAPQPGGYPPSSYQVQYSHGQPRTQPQYQYQPQQSGRESHPSYAPQADYPSYGQMPPETRTPGYPPAQSAPPPGYYIASDGRQYPISQQPQSNMGRRRN